MEDLLPSSLRWLLAGFSFSGAVGLRTSFLAGYSFPSERHWAAHMCDWLPSEQARKWEKVSKMEVIVSWTLISKWHPISFAMFPRSKSLVQPTSKRLVNMCTVTLPSQKHYVEVSVIFSFIIILQMRKLIHRDIPKAIQLSYEEARKLPPESVLLTTKPKVVGRIKCAAVNNEGMTFKMARSLYPLIHVSLKCKHTS